MKKAPIIESWGNYSIANSRHRKTALDKCPVCFKAVGFREEYVATGFHADPPFKNMGERQKCYATVAECPNCKCEYWFHVSDSWVAVEVMTGLWPEELLCEEQGGDENGV